MEQLTASKPPHEDDETIIAAAEQAMREQGLKQADLARMLHKTRGAVNQVFRSRRISAKMRKEFVDTLGLDSVSARSVEPGTEERFWADHHEDLKAVFGDDRYVRLKEIVDEAANGRAAMSVAQHKLNKMLAEAQILYKKKT